MPDRHIPDDPQRGFFSSLLSGENAIFFQTFFVSSLLGALYFILNFIYQEIRKHLTCSISMESSDKIFRKTLKFLTEKGYLKHSMSQMKVQIKPKE